MITLHIDWFIHTSLKVCSRGLSLAIGTASKFARGAVAALLLRALSLGLSIRAAAMLRILAAAALVPGSPSHSLAIGAAAKLVGVAGTSLEFGAKCRCVSKERKRNILM